MSVSTPLGEFPSITPNTPLPKSVWAIITSTGLAVAQNIEQTSGQFFIAFNTFIGKASFKIITKTCPAPIAFTFFMARVFSSESFPSALTRQGPEASLKARPNFIPGTAAIITS
ncbi:hypothetical protein ES705_45699 [subsurface metagenome]